MSIANGLNQFHEARCHACGATVSHLDHRPNIAASQLRAAGWRPERIPDTVSSVFRTGDQKKRTVWYCRRDAASRPSLKRNQHAQKEAAS